MLTFKSTIGRDGVRVAFSEKPPDAIRSILKANGFRWQPALAPAIPGCWWRRRVAGAADFLTALERDIGPRRPDGKCWACRAPEGYLRPCGPFAPVHCDACHAKHMARTDSPTVPMSASIDRPAPMGGIDVDLLYEDACRDACGL